MEQAGPSSPTRHNQPVFICVKQFGANNLQIHPNGGYRFSMNCSKLNPVRRVCRGVAHCDALQLVPVLVSAIAVFRSLLHWSEK
jgi:hypothetical protein